MILSTTQTFLIQNALYQLITFGDIRVETHLYFNNTWIDSNGNEYEGLPVLLSKIAVLNIKYNDYYLTISSHKLIARYKYITIHDGYYATIGSRIEYDYLNYTGSERKHIQVLQSMIDTVAVLFKEA